jgi:acyl-coenzyme A thioesterase PaaI-like protein
MDESKFIFVDLVKAFGNRRSYVSDEPNGERIQTRFYKRTDTQTLGAKVVFGIGTEGAPGLVHGGSIAAAMEETMRFAAWASGHAVLTVRLVTNFKQMLPLNSTAFVETRVEVIDATKLRVEGHLLGDGGAALADAECLFLIVPSAKFGVDAEKVSAMFAALQE